MMNYIKLREIYNDNVKYNLNNIFMTNPSQFL